MGIWAWWTFYTVAATCWQVSSQSQGFTISTRTPGRGIHSVASDGVNNLLHGLEKGKWGVKGGEGLDAAMQDKEIHCNGLKFCRGGLCNTNAHFEFHNVEAATAHLGDNMDVVWVCGQKNSGKTDDLFFVIPDSCSSGKGCEKGWAFVKKPQNKFDFAAVCGTCLPSAPDSVMRHSRTGSKAALLERDRDEDIAMAWTSIVAERDMQKRAQKLLSRMDTINLQLGDEWASEEILKGILSAKSGRCGSLEARESNIYRLQATSPMFPYEVCASGLSYDTGILSSEQKSTLKKFVRNFYVDDFCNKDCPCAEKDVFLDPQSPATPREVLTAMENENYFALMTFAQENSIVSYSQASRKDLDEKLISSKPQYDPRLDPAVADCASVKNPVHATVEGSLSWAYALANAISTRICRKYGDKGFLASPGHLAMMGRPELRAAPVAETNSKMEHIIRATVYASLAKGTSQGDLYGIKRSECAHTKSHLMRFHPDIESTVREMSSRLELKDPSLKELLTDSSKVILKVGAQTITRRIMDLGTNYIDVHGALPRTMLEASEIILQPTNKDKKGLSSHVIKAGNAQLVLDYFQKDQEKMQPLEKGQSIVLYPGEILEILGPGEEKENKDKIEEEKDKARKASKDHTTLERVDASSGKENLSKGGISSRQLNNKLTHKRIMNSAQDESRKPLYTSLVVTKVLPDQRVIVGGTFDMDENQKPPMQISKRGTSSEAELETLASGKDVVKNFIKKRWNTQCPATYVHVESPPAVRGPACQDPEYFVNGCDRSKPNSCIHAMLSSNTIEAGEWDSEQTMYLIKHILIKEGPIIVTVNSQCLRADALTPHTPSRAEVKQAEKKRIIPQPEELMFDKAKCGKQTPSDVDVALQVVGWKPCEGHEGGECWLIHGVWGPHAGDDGYYFMRHKDVEFNHIHTWFAFDVSKTGQQYNGHHKDTYRAMEAYSATNIINATHTNLVMKGGHRKLHPKVKGFEASGIANEHTRSQHLAQSSQRFAPTDWSKQIGVLPTLFL